MKKEKKNRDLSNYAVARILASRLEALGLLPYKSDRERFLITIPDESSEREIIELGPALKGSRFFRPNCATKDIALVDEFTAFCKEGGLKDCYYWSICLPARKAGFDNLNEELCRFNTQINNHFSELRKKYRFEQLALSIHVRYDNFSDAIDLHAHFICRVPFEHLDKARHLLNCNFSRPDLDVGPILNPAAAFNYMLYGIFDNREMVEWPDHALEAVWKLTQQKRFRYVRTGGTFGRWRRKARLANDNVPPKAKRQPSYFVDPTKPRFLARVIAKIHGKRVAALLFEHPNVPKIKPRQEEVYSTASRLVTQEVAAATKRAAHSPSPQQINTAWSRVLIALHRIAAPISSSIRKIQESGARVIRRLIS